MLSNTACSHARRGVYHMATKHLANFYSYKVSPSVVDNLNVMVKPGPAETQAATLESRVREHILRGNQQFFQDHFQEALDEYTAAYSLIHRFLHPSVPVFPGAIIAEKLRDSVAFDALLTASVEVSRYRHAAPEMDLISPDFPPEEIIKLVDEFGGAPGNQRPSLAESYYSQALGYLKIGATKAADAFLARAREAADGDRDLQAHIMAASGVIALQQRDTRTAQAIFNRAGEQFQNLQMQSDHAALSNNLGVLFSLDGNNERAGSAFSQAGDHLPVDRKST